MDFPEFPGWRMIGLEETIERGDAWVNPGHHLAKYTTPEGSEAYLCTGNYGRRLIDPYPPSTLKDWRLYRKTADFRKIPRILPIGSHFSKPLPLP